MKSLLQSLKVAGFTIVVRAIGAAKEIVVAGLFGTSDALDAFLGASVLPVLAINVLSPRSASL